MSKSPLSMPRPGWLISIQGDQRHSSWQAGMVKVEAEVDVKTVAGVFTDDMLLVVDAALPGDPGYTTLGVGLECVLEGCIEVMTSGVEKEKVVGGGGLVELQVSTILSMVPLSLQCAEIQPPMPSVVW